MVVGGQIKSLSKNITISIHYVPGGAKMSIGPGLTGLAVLFSRQILNPLF